MAMVPMLALLREGDGAESNVMSNVAIWAVLMLCILALVLTDVEGKEKRTDEKHHAEEKRKGAKQAHEHKEELKQVKKKQQVHQEMRLKNRKHTRGMGARGSGIG